MRALLFAAVTLCLALLVLALPLLGGGKAVTFGLGAGAVPLSGWLAGVCATGAAAFAAVAAVLTVASRAFPRRHYSILPWRDFAAWTAVGCALAAALAALWEQAGYGIA